ncbi:uncharacterized protein DS421_2g46020 [Arachis hypogaea]|nr:uncharacterized protein DS421_2g46020 [Arachis hypogaea]
MVRVVRVWREFGAPEAALPAPRAGQERFGAPGKRRACVGAARGNLVRQEAKLVRQDVHWCVGRCPARAKGRAGKLWCARGGTRASDAARTRVWCARKQSWCARILCVVRQSHCCPARAKGRARSFPSWPVFETRRRQTRYISFLASWHGNHP